MLSRGAVFSFLLVPIAILLHNYGMLKESICHTFLGALCFASQRAQQWSILYHLGGNGPWIPRASAGRLSPLPMGCEVTQAHMLSRHAERYPTTNVGNRHLALVAKLKSSDIWLTGSLAFLNDWEYFTDQHNPDFEKLTTHGPYAGTFQAFKTGQMLRERYTKLVRTNDTTKFWTCSSKRDVETAQYFANGFFGDDWQEAAAADMIVIPEATDRGADTLTPGDTCKRYREDLVYGHDRGYTELEAWQRSFTAPISTRLKQDAGGLRLTHLEVYSMMEMCGFEILARGTSPWCNVFSNEEWLDFEYARDLLHYYRAGPGNDYARVMGWLWLNATTSLLVNDTVGGAYLSFVHDGDIVPLLSTLEVFSERSHLPNHRRVDARNWKTSDITPMGGRLILEKVTCRDTGLGNNLQRSYVRLFINDGIVDLEKSIVKGGLAYSIGMKQWAEMVAEKAKQYGNFNEVCGLPKDSPQSISFLQPQYTY